MTDMRTAVRPEAELDQLCINTVRFLSVDAVQKANSGHPGMPLGAAHGLCAVDAPAQAQSGNPDWFDRDRFVPLGRARFDVVLQPAAPDWLRPFARRHQALPPVGDQGTGASRARAYAWRRGHDQSAGQGFANAVGMAIAEAQLASRYNRPGFEVIDHAMYTIVSDGDLIEGVAAEAASLAGHLRLGKLTCLYDNNYVSLAAGTDITFSEDRAGRFDAYGWHTVSVDDGNDLAEIDAALQAARAETKTPVVDSCAHAHWLRLTQQARQLRGARLTARRRRSPVDQAESWLAN